MSDEGFWNGLFVPSYNAREVREKFNEMRGAVSRGIAGRSDLRRDLARVALACEAIWELMRDRLNLSDEDLKKKIAEIDARDGVFDDATTSERVLLKKRPAKTKKKASHAVRRAYGG